MWQNYYVESKIERQNYSSVSKFIIISCYKSYEEVRRKKTVTC